MHEHFNQYAESFHPSVERLMELSPVKMPHAAHQMGTRRTLRTQRMRTTIQLSFRGLRNGQHPF
jgi:hypothetical protein